MIATRVRVAALSVAALLAAGLTVAAPALAAATVEPLPTATVEPPPSATGDVSPTATVEPPPTTPVEPPAAAPVKVPAPPVRAAARPTGPETDTGVRPVARVRFPVVGSRRYSVAPTGDAPIGGRGRLLRFRVAVERDIRNVRAREVAEFVERTLADPQGWTASGAWRFRRVGRGERYDFTIYLATPATRDVLCGMGYDRYTSCRNGRRVVLNVARWTRGVPHYRAPLTTYRRYMINHEVGHLLGHGHELCPGRGRPAPVMLQQTYGLHGCVANPWPYRHGRRYRGPAGAYV